MASTKISSGLCICAICLELVGEWVKCVTRTRIKMPEMGIYESLKNLICSITKYRKSL